LITFVPFRDRQALIEPPKKPSERLFQVVPASTSPHPPPVELK
jgi:hypothetical protein